MRRLFACLIVFGITGCFGRTGLVDDERFGSGADEDAATDGVVVIEAGDDTGTAVSDTAGEDRFIDIWDLGFPIPDSGPIGACASCVRDKCGDNVNKCINDPKCRSGLACTVTKCLAGGGGGGGPGGFDFMCILGCFDGDFAAAGTAVSTFSCVLGTCGSVCGGLLGGGLPGGGGGGGGGGGMRDAGSGMSGGGTPGGGKGFSFTPEEIMSLPPATRLRIAPDAFAHWRDKLH